MTESPEITEGQRAAAERVRDVFTELGITEADFVAEHGLISPERAHSKLNGIVPLSSLDYAIVSQLCIARGTKVTVYYLIGDALAPSEGSLPYGAEPPVAEPAPAPQLTLVDLCGRHVQKRIRVLPAEPTYIQDRNGDGCMVTEHIGTVHAVNAIENDDDTAVIVSVHFTDVPTLWDVPRNTPFELLDTDDE